MFNLLDKVYKRREGFPWQTLAEQSLILNTEKKQAHELNLLASFIWNHLDGTLNLQQITEKVCDEFEVERSEAEQDLTEFITSLESHRLVECL